MEFWFVTAKLHDEVVSLLEARAGAMFRSLPRFIWEGRSKIGFK